jgi:Zn-dependent peptidase ImmA (M78 family)
LDANFILDRLLPAQLKAFLDSCTPGEENDQGIALQLSSILKRIFGWSMSDLFGDVELGLDTLPAFTANFKIPSRTAEKRLHAYIVYAHYLALLVTDATDTLPRTPLTSKPAEFRKAVSSKFGEINFPNVLKYIWSMGVPVLPLADPGVFHGACWRIDGRNVIVLKQRTHSQARWLFDLLHEFWHIAQEPDKEHLSVIESDPASEERRDSTQEEEASLFAGDVVLAGRAEDFAKLCVREAKGKVELLKKVVPQVAASQRVPLDSLANYMAFRLSLQGINWWGTAENLQDRTSEPLEIARNLFFQNCNLGTLNEVDRQLLACALENFEER